MGLPVRSMVVERKGLGVSPGAWAEFLNDGAGKIAGVCTI